MKSRRKDNETAFPGCFENDRFIFGSENAEGQVSNVKQALLMLSVLLLDGLILYSFRRALLALRFGGCGKYVRKKKRTERLRELSLWDRLTLASVAAECKKPETAQRIRRLYLGYAVAALLSDAFLLFAAASKRLPLLWIWVAVCGSKWIVLAVLRILLFRNGLNRNPTV